MSAFVGIADTQSRIYLMTWSAAAREIGTFSLTTKGPSPKQISGKYLVVWERVRGQWKLAADIWNDGE